MAVLFSVLLASCTSAGNPPLSLGMADYTADGGISADASIASNDSQTAQVAGPQALMTAEGDAELPAEIAYLPSPSPGFGFPIAAPAGVETIAGNTPASLQPATVPSTASPTAMAEAAADVPAKTAEPEDAASKPVLDNPVYVTAGEMPKPKVATAPKKKSLFASLFGTSPAEAAPAPLVEVNQEREMVKPVITLASAEVDEKPLINPDEVAHASVNGALPGVRQTALFEIKRKSGIDDESDVDLNEDEGPGLYKVASAAGMARLAPNGLLKQTESVDVACLKPSLVRVLKTIENHYHEKMIVTSGYRDPNRNRRANGARNSMHMYCAAADIQLPGISKWELASYVRSMPGRGGVGTYCHTESVHVDVGPERDWNWRCRRRK
ncbi:MAG TPA: D-Ala-D-Ala carboxypeptidase family metallohydrolase [Mesorhizobium sp.]